jgi:DNA-binding MurR/RpiR family transcriptional regulator
MEQGPLSQQIVAAFAGLPHQLQMAARYVLDHPRDVALLSMREQARQANVNPATMTRLAQHLGVGGYDELRKRYAEAVRDGELGFAGRAVVQVKNQKLRGDSALAAEMMGSLARQFGDMANPEMAAALAAAARDLGRARRIFCLGLRSSHGAAWHFRYILSLFGNKGVLLDGPGGTGIDPIRDASSEDALFAVSVSRYTRATVETAAYVASRGVPVVALTDSAVAPLAKIARHVLIAPVESPSFFHTMAPTYALAEMLAVMVAGRSGKAALEALRRADRQMTDFNIHFFERSGARQR